MLPKEQLIPTLGYLGLIPFLFASYLSATSEMLLGLNPISLFIGYSAVILAFLGGSLWGKGLGIVDSGLSRALLVISNAIALAAWFGLSAGAINHVVAIAALLLGYALMLCLEYRLSSVLFANLNFSYINLRTQLTAIVLLLHIMVLFLIP